MKKIIKKILLRIRGEVPLEKLTCTIKLGNFSYETSLLSMLEDDKMWP